MKNFDKPLQLKKIKKNLHILSFDNLMTLSLLSSIWTLLVAPHDSHNNHDVWGL